MATTVENLLVNKSVIVSDTTVSTTINVIGEKEFRLAHRAKRVCVQVTIQDTGTAIAFDQFDIQAQFVNGGTWHTVAVDFGTPATDENNVVLFSPDDLFSLAHDATGVVIIDAGGWYAVRFRSAQAGATAEAITRTLEVAAQYN